MLHPVFLFCAASIIIYLTNYRFYNIDIYSWVICVSGIINHRVIPKKKYRKCSGTGRKQNWWAILCAKGAYSKNRVIYGVLRINPKTVSIARIELGYLASRASRRESPGEPLLTVVLLVIAAST